MRNVGLRKPELESLVALHSLAFDFCLTAKWGQRVYVQPSMFVPSRRHKRKKRHALLGVQHNSMFSKSNVEAAKRKRKRRNQQLQQMLAAKQNAHMKLGRDITSIRRQIQGR